MAADSMAVHSEGVAFMDGEFMPIHEARLPILDLGFTRSDATYDVVHVWNGAFFRLDDHLDRFERSVARWRFKLELSRDEIRAVLTRCVQLSGLRDAYVDMTVTRGRMAAGTRDPRKSNNRFIAYAIPFVWILPFARRYEGLHLTIAKHWRIPPQSVDPTVKNFHWGDLTQGLFEAYDRGGDTAVLVDLDDNVTEGPGFNVFGITNGRVLSPDTGVFEGITRQTVRELCDSLGIPVSFGKVSATELRAADEVFLSSTAGGIIPVNRIDGRILADGTVGPITRRLLDAYWMWHADPRFATPIDYSQA
jgi:branched-chain amino acid aminotransferase